MRKRKPFIIIIAIGAAICMSCIVFVGFNFDKFGKNYTLDDYELKIFTDNASEYSKLFIDVESTDVEVLTTDSDQIKISYYNMDQDYYTVSTVAGEINVTDTNELGSGFFGMGFGYSIPQKKVTIELPKTVSLDMDYNLKYGDASFYEISMDKELNLKTDSVEVKLQNVTSPKINIEAKYGEVELNDIHVSAALNITGTEATFQLKNINADQFVFYNKEGKLNIEKIQSKTVQCDTDSVTVSFAEMDSNDIHMTAKYGSITGSFIGNSDDYTVTGNIKDGKNNISNFKGTGSKAIHIKADSASANISFTE